jgi:S-DNA-T family DNA segregation ATPase FtsK/SpoIIIE
MRPPRFARNGSNGDHDHMVLLPPLDVTEATQPASHPAPETTEESVPETTSETTEETTEEATADRAGPAATSTNATGADRAGPGGLPPLANRPIIPAWLSDPVSTVAWAGRYTAHVTAFHLVRSPGYLARAAVYTPRGLARTGMDLYRWATDADAAPLMVGAVERRATAEWLAVNKARTDKTKVRGPAAGLLVLLAVVSVVAGLSAGGAVAVLTALAVVLVFGWRGRPVDRPFIESAVVSTPQARRLSGDAVSNAFAAAKLSRLPDHPITFWSKVARDGKGWGCVVDLPIGFGKTADDAIAARKRLAAALSVDEGRLFLARVRGDGGSAGRVSFWLADTDPMAGTPVRSPLLSAEKVDFWQPVPFGVDPRGRSVTISLLWTALLVGAVPRQGKSFAARLLAAAAALDPYVRLVVFDAKGSPDWRPFTEVAHRCGFGEEPDVVRHLLVTLEELVREMNRRADVISKMPRHQAREGKITREMTRNRRLAMPLVLLVIDEVHEYIQDPDHGKDIARLLAKLIKRGPALGIMGIFATQKPDSNSLPTEIRDQVSSRFALRVTTTQANDMILGSGAREQGFDATMLLPHHRGVGWLVGNMVPEHYEAGGVLIRTHYLDAVGADDICERGRKLREQTGTLTGQAAGETLDDSTVSMLDDIAAAFHDGEVELWSEEIIARIDHAHPGRYRWDPKAFGNAVRSLGLDTKQITRVMDGKPVNRRGLTREQVTEARERQAADRAAAGLSDTDD